jgi:predicted  nucleic acid-binding Zn-ribbon protein
VLPARPDAATACRALDEAAALTRQNKSLRDDLKDAKEDVQRLRKERDEARSDARAEKEAATSLRAELASVRSSLEAQLAEARDVARVLHQNNQRLLQPLAAFPTAVVGGMPGVMQAIQLTGGPYAQAQQLQGR